jgi:hypothetical protein
MSNTKASEALEKFDVNSLTLGEVAEIENLSGYAIGLMSDPSTPSAGMLTAVAYVIKKRGNPKYTYAMASTLTMGEVLELVGEDDEDTEKNAGAEA